MSATRISQALEACERLDAARDTARVEAGLRELGARRGRRGPRQRPPLGWDSLTPAPNSPPGNLAPAGAGP